MARGRRKSPSTFSARELLSLPGLLSLSRVAFAVFFPFVVGTPWLALTTIAVAGLSDMLDGYFARRLGGSTPTGAALDPITDKIFATSVMLSLVVSGRLPLAWAGLLSLRELLELPLLLWLVCVPHARVARAVHLKANWLGKLTTGLQFGALVSLLLRRQDIGLWVVATAVAGVLAAAWYWMSFSRALSQHNKSAEASTGDPLHPGAAP